MSAIVAEGTVLVLNCGSSSVKYELIRPDGGVRLAEGRVERIGEASSAFVHEVAGLTFEREGVAATHHDALRDVLAAFEEHGPKLVGGGIAAVGHRVVMGGDRYDRATLIDDEVIAVIEEMAPLAPLHNPPNLAGIEVARQLLPDVPHVAVFDTAFFHHLPAAAATYAIDREVAQEHAVRRYGFHGTSHEYVVGVAAEHLGRPLDELRLVVLHLGNGASASAIAGGRPVDTSMGLTPLEGLVMGTRGGDIDPGALVHLQRTGGMGVDEVDELLNRRSGLKGLSGHNDMRDVHRAVAAGDEAAILALDVYVHRLVKYVGAYAAVLGGIDALCFTAGVGENDPVVRARTVERLGFLGLAIDPLRNSMSEGVRVVSPEGSRSVVLVVPTDEELEIACQTIAVVEDSPA